MEFWADGVCCFSHEAVIRSMCLAFPDVTFAEIDLSLRKYEAIAENLQLETSAWREYLRNGPRYAFTLPSGTTGTLSRYEVEFQLYDASNAAELARIKDFLQSLCAGHIKIESALD